MINLQDVSFHYKIDKIILPILQNINLEINKGDSIAILGPSGSGKSTLLSLIGCFLKPQSGNVVIDSVKVNSLNDFELSLLRNKKIGFVFQQFHLLAKMTVLDNILLPTIYPCEIKKDDIDYVNKAKILAKRLGIEKEINKLPNQLSGGQQQRVAIARALINDAEIILADEPTGNLDSQNAASVLELLQELNKEGKTIVVITHDQKIAQKLNKIYDIQDGVINNIVNTDQKLIINKQKIQNTNFSLFSLFKLFPIALENLQRNRIRSYLTMLGICIGVAALLITSTLSKFGKEIILSSFAELGVNTINFMGYPNFSLTAEDEIPAMYRYFDYEKDLKNLKTIFPNIKRIAPQTQNSWSNTVSFAGKSISSEVLVSGVAEHTFSIINWPLTKGHGFFKYHIENKSNVCIIGSDIEKNLFKNIESLGQILHISSNNNSYVCKIIGVLSDKNNNKPWDTKPNSKVFLPYTFVPIISNAYFQSNVFNVLIEIEDNSSLGQTSEGIKNLFNKKYGKSGEFFVGFDSTLIEQMNKFLNIFSLILISIAIICLLVGGTGITNMMLVSLSERYKEIGLRKALGATHTSILIQFLLESLFLCLTAGIIGIIIGFAAYESAIYAASKLSKSVSFSWIIDIKAVIISFLSIIIVGFLSGLIPAIKAKKLQIAESLRSD